MALINDKKANKKEIISFFEALSGKKANEIKFYTPNQNERDLYNICSVGLFFGGSGVFGVGGDYWFDDGGGFSRGVLSNSAKQGTVLSKIISKRITFDFENRQIIIPMPKKFIWEARSKTAKNRKAKPIIDYKLRIK